MCYYCDNTVFRQYQTLKTPQSQTATKASSSHIPARSRSARSIPIRVGPAAVRPRCIFSRATPGATVSVPRAASSVALNEDTDCTTIAPPALATKLLPGCKIDRKSTRLNSSHGYISYAVFCLKKKKKRTDIL